MPSGFEECKEDFEGSHEDLSVRELVIAQHFWDASRTQALFEAANRAGDSANEGEKHERMVKAAAAISILYPDRTADWDKLKAIIEEAQG